MNCTWQASPRRKPCERQQLSNPVRFLCTLCTLIQTPEYDQRRPQQCREDSHKQKVSHYLFIFSSWSDTCSMIALRFPLCCLFSVVSPKKKVQSIAAATLPWTLVDWPEKNRAARTIRKDRWKKNYYLFKPNIKIREK